MGATCFLRLNGRVGGRQKVVCCCYPNSRIAADLESLFFLCVFVRTEGWQLLSSFPPCSGVLCVVAG